MSKRSGRSRLPAALKHGAYASVELLPWEDPSALEQLEQALFEELDPEGPMQNECVRDISLATWRKRRIRERRNVQARSVLLAPQNRLFDQQPAPLFETKDERNMFALAKAASETKEVDQPRDDYERLLRFSSYLTLDASPKIVKGAIGCLPQEYKDHLETRVPDSQFEATSHWIVAIKKEIDGVLLPQIRKRRPDADGYLAAAADLLAPEKMLEDLAIEERLDNQIDRALRRLFWLKTQKKLDREAKQKLINP
ncbi:MULTISPECIES: hypothetical protein [unclassified Bradyrhizobium]|uniref:hypothetical protein n=1 Tax=unclassified Bradyrhizobium TaxID=2631580 RepID=UPI0033930A82